MVPPDSDRIPRAPSYSGTNLIVPTFAYEAVTLYGHVSQRVLLVFPTVMICPTTPAGMPTGLGYSGFARRYYRNLD